MNIKKLPILNSGGCKQYGLKIQDRFGNIAYQLKLRGLTLDWEAFKSLARFDKTDEEISESTLQNAAYNEFKRMVLNLASFDEEESDIDACQMSYAQIRAQRMGGVHTVHTTKIYRPIIPKGVLIKNNFIVPFGYKS